MYTAVEKKQARQETLRKYEQSEKGQANRLRYRRALRQRLIVQLGGCCQDCGETSGLEFAHIKPTPIVFTKVGWKGQRDSSISSKARDIRLNPDCYRLLCVKCHEQLDRSRNGFKKQAGAFRLQTRKEED